MRQIVLDTETTGLEAIRGHRIIEVAAVELVDRRLSGRQFHEYINPQRQVDEGAFRVHGLHHDFLQDKPLFIDILPSLMEFIRDSELIIHNAPFDLEFLNTELRLAQWPSTVQEHCSILDTLVLARKQHPGQRNSLDALCKRYDIDNSKRLRHGALMDAELLAFVYLAMTGGQKSLVMEDELVVDTQFTPSETGHRILSQQTPVYKASAEELARHQAFLNEIEK